MQQTIDEMQIRYFLDAASCQMAHPMLHKIFLQKSGKRSVNGSHTKMLPVGFDDLWPVAAPWADLTSQNARYLLRQSMSFEDLNAFYETMAPRLPEIFDYLDQLQASAMDQAQHRLFNAALGVAEAALAVEYFDQPRMRLAPDGHTVETVTRRLT
jgi:hypothetical protein